MGKYSEENFDDRHVEAVLNLKLTDLEAVKKAGFRVVVDSINSVGGIILPKLLDKLGVEYKFLNGEPNGDFAHNPEPLEKNLTGIMDELAKGGYDLGIVVDPDVDRLAFICEDGKMFGEEYTLVSVADTCVERTKIARLEDGTVAYRADNKEDGEWVRVDENAPVSMNMWGFTPDYFEYSEEYFKEFLSDEANIKNLKSEFFIPLMVNKLINDGTATCKVLDTTSKWFGVTYSEDRPDTVARIAKLVEEGVYPNKLF